MLNTDLVLYIIAAVLFFLAGFNVSAPVRFEWLAAAVLVISLIV